MADRSNSNHFPDSLKPLCDKLAEASCDLERSGIWPKQQIQWCRESGVFRWFIPQEFGGLGLSERQLLDGYLALSQSCLTTTFILTQWVAACRRIEGSDNKQLRTKLLAQLADGAIFATVGISHLTTSRQHVREPVLTATQLPDGTYCLNGFSPWVTSAPAADLVVIGATMDDGKQIICAVPTDRPGFNPHSGESLVALTPSCTDRIDLDSVSVFPEEIVAGPIENVMQTNSGGGAGGLQTSTLAVGLSMAAVQFLHDQASKRPDLQPIAEKMQEDVDQLHTALVALTTNSPTSTTAADLRQHANSLVLRSTQAALSAAKGAGFLSSHPTGRWAREALFFLVWSCPQPIVTANLCELAQLT